MSRATTPALEPAFSPLELSQKSLAVKIGAVIFGTALMTASSYVSVPMIPVPMTMQTLAATLIGALYGWRLGALTIAVWLLQGALGLPVFSNGAGGIVHLFGRTGGYLFAFPIAAAATGFLAERGWNGDRVVRAFLAMLAGNALCLVHRRRLARDADRRGEGVLVRRRAVRPRCDRQIRARRRDPQGDAGDDGPRALTLTSGLL